MTARRSDSLSMLGRWMIEDYLERTGLGAYLVRFYRDWPGSFRRAPVGGVRVFAPDERRAEWVAQRLFAHWGGHPLNDVRRLYTFVEPEWLTGPKPEWLTGPVTSLPAVLPRARYQGPPSPLLACPQGLNGEHLWRYGPGDPPGTFACAYCPARATTIGAP